MTTAPLVYVQGYFTLHQDYKSEKVHFQVIHGCLRDNEMHDLTIKALSFTKGWRSAINEEFIVMNKRFRALSEINFSSEKCTDYVCMRKRE